MKIMKFRKSRFQIIKIPQQIYRYFTTFSKMQNVSFCDPSNAFPIILHGDFTDFRERVAQKLLYAVVYWSFSSTFLDIRVKMPKIPTYSLSYLMLFELQNSVVAALKIPIKPKEYWWFREAIFQEKHLNRQPGVRTGFRFSGPGPIRDRNGGRVPQNTKKTTAKQRILGPLFSIFPGIHVNLHNRVCFLVLLEPIFGDIVYTWNSTNSDRTGRRGFDATFVTFPRPENDQ